MIKGVEIRPGDIEVIDDQSAEMFRRMTPAQRVRIADAMYRDCRRALHHLLRSQFPEWSQEQVEREVIRRISHGAV